MNNELINFVKKQVTIIGKSKKYSQEIIEDIQQDVYLALLEKNILDLSNKKYVYGMIRFKSYDYFNHNIKRYNELINYNGVTYQPEIEEAEEEDKQAISKQLLFEYIKQLYFSGKIKNRNKRKYKIYMYMYLGYDYKYIMDRLQIKRYNTFQVSYHSVRKEIEQHFNNK